MFQNVGARYALRAGVAMVLALLGALQVAIFDGSISGVEWVGVMTASVTALAGYLGVGAVVAPVEPNIGREADYPDA